MNCYIRVINGVPSEHPIIEQNMIEALPDVDLNNLPPEFARFIRVEPSMLGVYEKNQTVSYELVEGSESTFTDTFHNEAMTPKEITAKQDAAKAEWALSGFASWVFDEVTCTHAAPIEMPVAVNGPAYMWDEATISWVEAT